MNPSDPVHRRHMARAIELARMGWGRTHPNPLVGCVIVERGEVVAEGYHRAAGEPHAEIEALRALGRKPTADATLYVTLEPCSTRGRTGACTEAIREAGLRRVVVGATDPNPAHAGRGLSILRENGVEVIDGVLAADCADSNLIFNHWISRNEPLFAMKVALTLDGKFAAASGHSRWVTGESARADVMRWRRYFPAIATTADTVLADDPALTSRRDGETRCPRRFVLDRNLRTVSAEPLRKLYIDEFRDRTTVVHGPGVDPARAGRLDEWGIVGWELPLRDGRLDLSAFRQRCGEAGIGGVYFEPGPRLATRLLEPGGADYVFAYQAPLFLADREARGIGAARHTQSMKEAIRLRGVRRATFGEDGLVRGFVAG